MKPLLCALALLAFAAPMQAQTDDAKPNQPAPVAIDDGLIVTPLEVPPDIVAKMMSIEMWRFKVSAPAKDRFLTATLQLRRPDATAQFLRSSTSPMPREAQYTFGFMPVKGDNFLKAETSGSTMKRAYWKTFQSRISAVPACLRSLQIPGSV